jgi:hypothetical protein
MATGSRLGNKQHWLAAPTRMTTRQREARLIEGEANRLERRIRQLEHAAGRTRRCPGDTCSFWADKDCAVSRHWADFAGSRELTDLLLDLRERLGHRDSRCAFREFHPPGLARRSGTLT